MYFTCDMKMEGRAMWEEGEDQRGGRVGGRSRGDEG